MTAIAIANGTRDVPLTGMTKSFTRRFPLEACLWKREHAPRRYRWTPRQSTPLLQAISGFCESLQLRFRQPRKREVEALEGTDDQIRDRQTSKPLVIGRYDEPRRVVGAG